MRALTARAGETDVRRALGADMPDAADFAALISPDAGKRLEQMARRAQAITRRHFGNTISLYVPLYLSNYCPGGCAYCGYASDRRQARRKLNRDELRKELEAIRRLGFEDILLLTGERTRNAGFDYLLECTALAAEHFHNVGVESFAMSRDEYASLARAGCTGITLYQETYDTRLYSRLHRWGPKRNYAARLQAPARALDAGMRTCGIGVLLGLGDPVSDALCLFSHAARLRKDHWRSGIMISFPRLCPQTGGFKSPYRVGDRFLAQLIFAFRICMPDVPLVLSTRERAAFRDGVAGVGISRMSVASRTTVGGYAGTAMTREGQFQVSDSRGVKTFCAMLRSRGLEPVFKNWDAVLHGKSVRGHGRTPAGDPAFTPEARRGGASRRPRGPRARARGISPPRRRIAT